MVFFKSKCWRVNFLSQRVAQKLLTLLLALVPTASLALSVDDYGAVGDGVSWDHGAIQSAVDAAGEGGIVEFAAGKVYVACGQIALLSNQTILGNGATLKRCNAPTTILLQPATIGSTNLVVDDPGVFESNQFITPVNGSGSLNDGEHLTRARFQSSNGQDVTISNALTQDYPAGASVVRMFDQISLRTGVTGGTIDSLTFDGNKDNNQTYLGWTFNNALVTRTGLTVINSVFKNTPGNAITAFGTDVLITNNLFSNLDGPIVHLSGNSPTDETYVTISENTVSDTNFQSERMGHSEGVITISRFNNSIKVLDNVIQRADVPFISLFHDEMGDWLIEGNNVSDTKGIFGGNLRTDRPELLNIEFKNNQFTNVGVSEITRSTGAAQIRNFNFTDNTISGGSLEIDGLVDSAITNNTITSCAEQPILLTESVNVVVVGNIISSDSCGSLTNPATGEEAAGGDDDVGIDSGSDGVVGGSASGSGGGAFSLAGSAILLSLLFLWLSIRRSIWSLRLTCRRLFVRYPC